MSMAPGYEVFWICTCVTVFCCPPALSFTPPHVSRMVPGPLMTTELRPSSTRTPTLQLSPLHCPTIKCPCMFRVMPLAAISIPDLGKSPHVMSFVMLYVPGCVSFIPQYQVSTGISCAYPFAIARTQIMSSIVAHKYLVRCAIPIETCCRVNDAGFILLLPQRHEQFVMIAQARKTPHHSMAWWGSPENEGLVRAVRCLALTRSVKGRTFAGLL